MQTRKTRSSRKWKQIGLGNGMCLDVEGGSKKRGAAFISYGCHTGPNQRFRRTKRGELQAKHSGKCLDTTTFRQRKCKK